MIRTADPADAAELLAIYSYYAENTAVSFETSAPSLEEFRSRIENTLKKYPYLVYTDETGRILGYTYAGPFKGRAAYDWAVETTVYVEKDSRRSGVGRKLYTALEDALKKQNIINMYACIAYKTDNDPHLTLDSVRFHERMGFEKTGQFHKCGYKFDHWYDMIWMEKILSDHTVPAAPVIPFNGGTIL